MCRGSPDLWLLALLGRQELRFRNGRLRAESHGPPAERSRGLLANDPVAVEGGQGRERRSRRRRDGRRPGRHVVRDGLPEGRRGRGGRRSREGRRHHHGGADERRWRRRKWSRWMLRFVVVLLRGLLGLVPGALDHLQETGSTEFAPRARAARKDCQGPPARLAQDGSFAAAGLGRGRR